MASSQTVVLDAVTSEQPNKKLRLVEPEEYERDSRIYEYTSAANPHMAQVPVLAHPASLHESGATRIIPFDLSRQMQIPYAATSPNLMASFIRINPGDNLSTDATATSQAFYIIRGSGSSVTEHGTVTWSEGDLFVLPATETSIVHTSTSDTAIYWVTDEPLMRYLGVKPNVCKFNMTLFRKEKMLAEVERIKHQPGSEHRNRMGILLGNKITEDSTKTLTHVLWSLLNVLPAGMFPSSLTTLTIIFHCRIIFGDAQRPHRHNSVAIDLCVSSEPEGVYTLMGPELDEEGWVKNPIRCDWKTGAAFTTPPGWWHSHHNDTDQPAWVLPMQDAGLYTHQRTLDIRFSTEPPKPIHRSNGNSNSSNSSSNSDILDGKWTESDPYVEQKTQVAKMFEDPNAKKGRGRKPMIPFVGTVIQHGPESAPGENDALWKIMFEDGDKVDMDMEELQEGIALYHSLNKTKPNKGKSSKEKS